MRVGVITEGLFDQEVVISILKGAIGIHDADVSRLRPELSLDRTDLSKPHHTMTPNEYGNWALVREECMTRAKIGEFLDYVDETRFLIVHIDTDRSTDFGVDKPTKNRDQLDQYVDELRQRVVATITGWLNGEYVDQVVFAIAIEETEAWLLAHWESDVDETAKHEDPKVRINRLFNTNHSGLSEGERRRVQRLGEQERGAELSKPLRKRKTLFEATTRSRSLRMFVEQLPKPEL